MRNIKWVCFALITLSTACGSVSHDPDASSGDDAPPPDAPGPSVTVNIAPAAPITSDDLVATVGNGPTGYTLRWSENASPRLDITGATVANAETARDEVWRVEVMVGTTAVASDEVTIQNAAPTAPVASVPDMPRVGNAIRCTVATPSSDLDADTITYSATWTRNGSAFTGTTTTNFMNDTVPAGTSTEGDVFACTVIASDGIASAMSGAVVSMPTCVGVPLPGAQTFAYTGAAQTYTVPGCVNRVRLEVWGAQGSGEFGGRGGYARGDLIVTSNQTLSVYVGGQTGFNGGGTGIRTANPAHGGGASDIRTGGTGLANRVIVGGGGGGGMQTDITTQGNYTGGAGGGGSCGANYCGGGAGLGYQSCGLAGVGGLNGGSGVTGQHCGPAGGGGLNSGGGRACDTYNAAMPCGVNGVLGVGGNGSAVLVQVCADNYGGTAGGGGGYYGGGGSATGFCGGGGAGGGSSWTGSLTAPAMSGGAKTGNGQIIITPI